MSTSGDTQLASEHNSWCRDTGLEPNHAFVLHDVPNDNDKSDIESAALIVKAFGKVRVKDKLSDTKTGTSLVLCECSEYLNPEHMPPFLKPENGGSWKVTLFTASESSDDDFPDKLNKLMAAEGKTLKDVHALMPSEFINENSPESIIRAVGDLPGKTMKPTNENNAFRRLRMFSGNLPVPAGEESLDNWLEQARLMIEECDCSAREKRKRIVESLKGPALEIIQAVRLNNPDAGPECCIEALESAFGTPESGEDLYFAFRSMYQQPGEKLSGFLRRLERSLTKVVHKGGLLPHRVDRSRIDQLIRGATESDMMLLNLRLRERKEQPPTFLKLLNEIREEEEYESARRKLNTTVRQVKTCEEMKPKATGIQELQAEIKELRAELGGLRDKQQEAPTELKLYSNNKATDSGEVQLLRQQVQQLQHQLTVLSVSHSSGTADPKQKNGRAKPSRAENPNAAKDSESYFCYRCGGDRHIATRCMAPENPSKVIQKLLGALRKCKEEKETHKSPTEDKEVVSIRKGSVDTSQLGGLPEGLVGPSQMATVKFEGQPCRVLLDGGSRVTIIFESWYSQFI